jgi:acyl carrier protein
MNVINDETVAKVKTVVVTTLGIEDRADTIDASTPLLGALPEMDSLAVVELVVTLHSELGVLLADDEINADVFETLGSLADAVDGKLRTR